MVGSISPLHGLAIQEGEIGTSVAHATGNTGTVVLRGVQGRSAPVGTQAGVAPIRGPGQYMG